MRRIFTLLFLFFAFAVQAQQLVVKDQSSLQAIANVHITSKKDNIALVTNPNGKVGISSLKNADSIVISHLGYYEAEFSYQELKSLKFTLLLWEKNHALQEVVVSASRFEEKKEDIPQAMQVIDAKELAFTNTQTAADVLQQSGNVFVQKSQLGGGSPVIRGFETNKVLMVVDGVRMNNAIYRGGHLQNVVTVDNNMLDRVEIAFGPSSVVYGSDALGGVMHFFSKKPLFSTDDTTLIKTKAFTRYSTAYNEKTAHVDMNLGFRKFASLTSITVSDFGDLRQGNNRNPLYEDWGKRTFYVEQINGVDSALVNSNVNIQKQSGYKQLDILQKFRYQHNATTESNINVQFSNSSNMPRYDRLSQLVDDKPKYGQWYYGPQKRLLTSYTFQSSKKTKLFDDVKIIGAYQLIEESRHTRLFKREKLNHRTEQVDIFSLNVDLAKEINKHELRYGAEVVLNEVNSRAETENINSGSISGLATRYPDGGSSMNSFAAYVTHAWEISDKVILSDGLRLSNIQLASKFVNKTYFPFLADEVTQNNTALAGNLGLVIKPGKDWRINSVLATGFRAPNVDDLGKVFDSAPGSVVVPNPNLAPEKTVNIDLGISKVFNKKITIGTTVYHTWYQNAITITPSTFNGQDSIVYDGVKSQVNALTNARKATILGGNAYVEANLSKNFSINSTINYTYGRIKAETTTSPLDHISPMFGKTSFMVRLNKFKGEFFAIYNGWKRVKDYNIFGEDNFALATPDGTPAWITLNIRTAYQINDCFQAQVALENIMDTNYRVFASGIHAAGRNLVLTLRGNF